MSEATKVLLVMTPVLGHLTYGNLFKSFLTEVGDREDLARHLGFLIGNPELRRSMGIEGAARAGELFDARKNFMLSIGFGMNWSVDRIEACHV